MLPELIGILVESIGGRQTIRPPGSAPLLTILRTHSAASLLCNGKQLDQVCDVSAAPSGTPNAQVEHQVQLLDCRHACVLTCIVGQSHTGRKAM